MPTYGAGNWVGGVNVGSSAPPAGASNPSQLAPTDPGYNPAWTPTGGGAGPPEFATMTNEQYLAAGLYGGQPTTPAITTPPLNMSLVQIANSRPDVLATAKAQGGDPFTAGTKANQWLNDWWNSAGKNEYPNVNLTQPQITTNQLNQSNALGLPVVSQQGDFASSMVKGVEAFNKNLQSMFATQETDAEKKQQDFLNQIASLTGVEAGKGAEQLATEQGLGIPALKQQLATLNSQILTKTAEFYALQTSYEQANQAVEGKPITLASIQGQQAQNYKMFLAQKNSLAAELGLLQAQALGLQGQVAAAQETANRAIDLKYSTVEFQIQVYKAQLDAIQPILDREEKTRSLAQGMMINAYNQQIADSKTEEKNQTNYALTQMNNYKDAGIQITDTYDVIQQKVLNSASYKQSIAPTPTKSTSGGETTPEKPIFTQTQLNKGSANAEVSTTDFTNFSDDGKNYFINGMSNINDIKKGIDQNISQASALEKEISESELPPEVKNYLVKYIHKTASGSALTTPTVSGGTKLDALLKALE